MVIAEGKLIAEGAPEDVVREKRVIEAYLGQGAAERLAKGSATGGGAHG